MHWFKLILFFQTPNEASGQYFKDQREYIQEEPTAWQWKHVNRLQEPTVLALNFLGDENNSIKVAASNFLARKSIALTKKKNMAMKKLRVQWSRKIWI